MAVKLVTYDLNREAIRPAITKLLHETWASWAMLSESSYAIETGMSHEAVYGVFEPLLDDNDALFVFDLKQPVVGRGPDEVVQWLGANLTY